MELINWSLNAIDKIFSTKEAAVGEIQCPPGTYPTGYVRDAYQKDWSILCLFPLSLEDVEDIYIFWLVMVGTLLTLLGLGLVYRKNDAGRAEQPALPQGFPQARVLDEVGRPLANLHAMMCDLGNKLAAMRGEIATCIAQRDSRDTRNHRAGDDAL